MTMPVLCAGVIVVTAPAGSTVTAARGDRVYAAEEVNGTWTFRVREKGSYTIRGVKGGDSATVVVQVTERRTYETTLTYVRNITLTVTGRGSVNNKTVAKAGNYSAAGTYTMQSGAPLKLYVYSGSASYTGKITVNGAEAATTGGKIGAATYTVYPVNDITVALSARAISTTTGCGTVKATM